MLTCAKNIDRYDYFRFDDGKLTEAYHRTFTNKNVRRLDLV